tara:strand:- start:226 stop:786 length:561 start_codon:yes stop_codon:yes gene_type:complete
MVTEEITIRITPEELSQRADSILFELVDGELLERSRGSISSEIAIQVSYLIKRFLEGKNAGRCYGPDLGYRCIPDDPDKIRKPDVSFIQSSRLTNELIDVGYMPIAPDLAVEVTSPGELTYTIDEKIEDYLQAGCQMVWVANPRLKIVDVYRPAGTNQRLHINDRISGENALPGFECSVGDFFVTI